MKKLFVTIMSIAITSLFLVACGSDGGGSGGPAPHPYPQCEGLSSYDYERCIEQYYPGSVGHTGNYIWDTGVVSVNSTARDRLASYIESTGTGCQGLFPNSSWLGGCERVGERIRFYIQMNSLSSNQTVTIQMFPQTRTFDGYSSSATPLNFTGHIRRSGNKLRIDAQPIMIIIDQDKLYEGSMNASIYLDGALIANTGLSYYSSYYNNNDNCTANFNSYPTWGGGWNESGGTYCQYW